MQTDKQTDKYPSYTSILTLRAGG